MIGRGVISDPFLPYCIKWPGKDCGDRILQFRAFHDGLFQRYQAALSGPAHLLDRMKGLWRYFSEGFENGRDIRKRIHKSTSIEHYLDVVQRYFEGQPARMDRR